MSGLHTLTASLLSLASLHHPTASGVAPNHEGKTEINPLLHTLTAVLSRGPVSIGDRPGRTDFKILRPCCSSSGAILSPSHALVPIDATYQPGTTVNKHVVWTSHSRVNDSVWYSVLAVSLETKYGLRPAELWPPPAKNEAPLWSFEWAGSGCAGGKPASGCLTALTDDSPLMLFTPSNKPPGVHPMQYSVVVRSLAGGWVLLGEVSKYVSISPARFTLISVGGGGDTLELSVRGAPGEEVDVLLKKPAEVVLASIAMKVGASGVATVVVKQ
jgi:hypothetical protein